MNKELRLAKFACRKVVEKHGTQIVHCFSHWRLVKTDGNYRLGTVKCINGHETRGKFALLANPMPTKRSRNVSARA